MKFAEYVISGWVITGATLLAYWVRLGRRIRRAENLDTDT
jgi:HAMP domain-containing protein